MKLGKINIASRLMNTGAAVGGGLLAGYIGNSLLPQVLKDNYNQDTANLAILGVSAIGPAFLPKKIQTKYRDQITAASAGMATVAGLNFMKDKAPDIYNKAFAGSGSAVEGIATVGSTDYAYQEETTIGNYVMREFGEAVSGDVPEDERDLVS